MTYAIVYASRTGNTRLLGEVIREALPAAQCLHCGAPDPKALEADVLYVGFWTDKGTCPQEIGDFLAQVTDQKVFLFGTAGFGADQAYYDRIIQAAACELPESVKLKASFMCQGKMQQGVLERYRSMLEANPQDGRAKLMVDNYHAALTHPDGTDMAAFQHFLISSVPAAGMGE